MSTKNLRRYSALSLSFKISYHLPQHDISTLILHLIYFFLINSAWFIVLYSRPIYCLELYILCKKKHFYIQISEFEIYLIVISFSGIAIDGTDLECLDGIHLEIPSKHIRSRAIATNA